MDYMLRLVRLVRRLRPGLFHRTTSDFYTGGFGKAASTTAHGGRLRGGAGRYDDIYGAGFGVATGGGSGVVLSHPIACS